MSKTLRADAPVPAIPAEQFPRLLAGLTRAESPDRSVLTLQGIGRLIVQAHAGRAMAYPRIAMRLDDALIAAIEAQEVLYPLRQPQVADAYYVEYIPEMGTLWLKYQMILGSRLLMALTPAQSVQFEQAILRLIPGTSGAAAEGSDASLLAEIGLLTVQGQRLELPAQQLVHYARIKALVQAAGGRYACNGFTFEPGCDVAALLAQLRAGGQPNPKKERQAFFTPPVLAAETVAWAGDLAGKRVLEPSAGEGALADAARAAGARVLAVESHGPSARILHDKGYEVLERDFLALSPAETGLCDAVIANPPFTRGQDMAHVMHMWRFLRPGGVLASLMSPGWRTGRTKAQREFQSFVERTGALVEELPAGAFKASGTHVAAVRIRVDKPVEALDGPSSDARAT